MKKIALLVFTLSLSWQNSFAESPKTHEFKNGELIIYSKNTKAKSVPAKVGTIDKENQRFTIPVDSRLDAFTSNDLIWDDYSSEDFSLYVEKDYIQSNQILIPKGSIFSGHAHHRSNRRVDFNIDYLELPNGKKYYISAEARNPNGKDYVQAQYIRQNSSGKKIASRTFGSAARGVLGRTLGGSIVEDAAYGAGSAATDEAEDAVVANSKSSYAKLAKNTKVKVIFLKSL